MQAWINNPFQPTEKAEAPEKAHESPEKSDKKAAEKKTRPALTEEQKKDAKEKYESTSNWNYWFILFW